MKSPNMPHTDETSGRWEQRDVSIRAVVALGASIVAVTVLSFVMLWALLGWYENKAQQSDPVASPVADLKQIPPTPHLQATPNRNYQEFRREQERLLTTYGWADKQEGRVRIPIDRAMEKALEEGLPKPQIQPMGQDESPAGEDANPPRNDTAPQNDTPSSERSSDDAGDRSAPPAPADESTSNPPGEDPAPNP